MELPHLGKNCSNPVCKQLDFLPMKCDACGKTFCKDHIQYDNHSCPDSYRKDNQIPVCPLCNIPCPVQKGELPDAVVGRHIDNDCQSDPAKARRKVYTNKCSFRHCKQKELMPVTCERCHKNFCLRHRHEQDHNCTGFEGTGQSISWSGAAAVARSRQPDSSSSSSSVASTASRSSPQQTTLSGFGRQLDVERRNRQGTSGQIRNDIIPGHMTEEEALRHAMQISMNTTGSSQKTNTSPSQQEQEDLLLAQAIAASEEEERRRSTQRATTGKEKSCLLS